MSHFLDRLTYFTREQPEFSDGHGVVSPEDRTWEDAYACVVDEIMDDAEVLPGSYDDWLVDAQDAVDQLRSQGVAVVAADIVPRTFLTWCERSNHHPDALARRTFASALALASVYPHAGRA